MRAPRRYLLLLPAALATGVYAADPAPLAAPDRPGAFAKDRAADMIALDLAVTLDPVAHSVQGVATWTVRTLAPGPLRLDAVAFHDVTATVDGAAVTVTPGVRELTIPMPVADPGSEHVVVVTYAVEPQLGLHWRGPPKAGGGADSPDTYLEVYSQGEGEDNRYWFPSYDHPDDRFAYQGRVAIAGSPAGWTAITNSGPDLPSYLVMLAAAPYDVVAGPSNAVPLRALVPPGTPRDQVAPCLDPLPDMLTWFAERTGVPYPWDHYDQTFVQRFIYGGMENTASTIMTRRLLSPPSVQATRSWVPSIVAHELAHQWYGDLLTARTAREMWLNEGFATFFAADWEVHAMRAKEGDAAADAFAAAQVDGWRRASLDRGGLAGRWYLDGGGATHAGAALGAANHNPYSKGAMVLTMLRRYLGEDTFWAGIRDYTKAHAHSSVDTIDLQRAMEARSGRDLGWLFQQWTELPVVPKVTTSWSWSTDAAGRGQVSVELRQEVGDGDPLYALPVDISVGGASPTRAWLRGASSTVTVPAEAAPAYVAIDPNGGLLVDWKQAQSPEAWTAQLRTGSPYARLFAAQQLADLPAAQDDALASSLADTTVPQPLRAALATALGTRRTCEPLLPLLRDADPRLRSAAAGALGRCASRPLAAIALSALSTEPNSDIRSTLLRSAAAIDPPAALPVARRTLTRSDALEPERAAAADVIGLAGTPTDVPALLRTPAGRDVRVAGLRAAVRIVQREALGPKREALRLAVARSAERLLSDLDLRGIQAGMGLLRDVGDAQSAALLEALARSTTLPDTADSARSAVAAIGARIDSVTPATPNEVDARLKAMEDRVKTLESDLERR